MVHRRQVLRTTLAPGTAAAAGCVSDEPSDNDSTNSSDDGEPPSDLTPTADGVYRIDVDAVSDRSATIGDDRRLSYDGDPEVVWGYDRILESDRSGETDATTPEVAVEPVIDTTDDVENLFPVPAYDADAEQWVIHAYADEGYYEGKDVHRFWIGRFYAESDDDRPIRGHDAAFTEHYDGVYRATLEYGETPAAERIDRSDRVFVTNRAWSEAGLEEPEPIVGAAVGPVRVGPPTPDYDAVDEDDPAPMVEFSFAYDPDAKTVTIVHEDGPSFRGDDVRVEFEAGITEDQFSGEVSAGDSLEVEVPSADPGEYLGIAWLGSDEEHYIILDRFRIPE